MIASDNTKPLARPARAFEVDAGWYQAHWYTENRTEQAQGMLRIRRFLLWTTIVVVSSYAVGGGGSARSTDIKSDPVAVTR